MLIVIMLNAVMLSVVAPILKLPVNIRKLFLIHARLNFFKLGLVFARKAKSLPTEKGAIRVYYLRK